MRKFKASSVNLFLTRWKVFSIGLRFGERAGMRWNSASISLKAQGDFLLVWFGSLSIMKRLAWFTFGPAYANVMFKHRRIKWEIIPGHFLIAVGHDSTFSCAIATIRCKRLPPGSSLLPLAVRSPSPSLSHTFDFFWQASLGLNMCIQKIRHQGRMIYDQHRNLDIRAKSFSFRTRIETSLSCPTLTIFPSFELVGIWNPAHLDTW